MNTNQKPEITNFEADIVVIGSGGGLAAAVTAAEKGVKNIIVLEKQDIAGGNSRIAQGLFACESPVQKRKNLLVDRDECFKYFMNWHHWAGVNPRIARAYINKSGETIKWFQSKGIEFEIKAWYPAQKLRGFHWPLKGKGPEFGGGAELIRVLIDESKKLGINIMLRTRAKKILLDSKAMVSGIIVEQEGREQKINTKCVIISTGSFAGNTDLIKKLCPDSYHEDMFIWEGMKPYTGDGILMAAEVGAAISDRLPATSEGPAPDYPSKKGSLSADINEPFAGVVREPNTMWVNKNGRRFVDETTGFLLPVSANAIALQPDKKMFTLFDDHLREEMEKEGLIVGRGWGAGEEGQRTALPNLKKILERRSHEGDMSLVKITNSWDEMAKWIGADPYVLKNEVEEYNRYCDQGYDTVFAKERRFLIPLRTPPFYGIRCIASSGVGTGGIIINEHMEVISTKGSIIPGLYATGDAASGIQGQTYCGELCGSGLGFAMNSARIAGENAALFILGK